VIKGWTKPEQEGNVDKGLEKLAYDVSKGRALLDDLYVEGLKAINGPCEVEETAPKRVALKPRQSQTVKSPRSAPQPHPEPEPEPEPELELEPRQAVEDRSELEQQAEVVSATSRHEAEQLLSRVSLQERLRQVQEAHEAKLREVQPTDQEFHNLAVRTDSAAATAFLLQILG
jgi:hypothetical protein